MTQPIGDPFPIQLKGDQNVIAVVDFPWKFKDKLPGDHRGACKNYRDMTLGEGRAFDVVTKLNMAADSLLFLWRVSAMPREALDLLDAWGYTPHSEICWQKLTKNGKPWFGMGRIVRGSHESMYVAARGDFEVEHSHEACLISRRGRPLIASKSIRSSFSAPVAFKEDGSVWHSAKPDEFYTIVDQLVEGPKVDMFARKYREGWTCVGDELGGHAPIPAVELDPDDPDNW